MIIFTDIFLGGAKVIDTLSTDLRKSFPEMKGFSARNLKYMRKLAEEYPDKSIVQALLAQLTWYHNITLLDKVSSKKDRLFYINKAAEHGWSRNMMVHQIELKLHTRQGNLVSNFEQKLPAN